MEQRPLRLGDILDDYCPRERRVTNHAVVAMVEDTVKQTRCTTCDAEHPYKGGQAPRRRKKETPSALYKEVLAGKPDDAPVRADVPEAHALGQPAPEVESFDTDHGDELPAEAEGPAVHAELAESEVERQPEIEEGPVHRQLIRATLPRIEGQKEERRPTDFTIRQSNGRGNAHGNFFRGGNDRMRSGRGQGGNSGGGFGGNHRGNGHRPQGGSRFAGARPGQGQGQGRGQGGGFRSGQPQQQRQGGGRKRSR
jgi:hypothetical protein